MRWAAAALAGLALAACGTQQVATSSASQPARPPAHSRRAQPGGALCAQVGTVTRLVVSRVTALPRNHLHFVMPAAVTIASPAAARGVARAICALPAVAHGAVMNCPADLGVSYRLSFAAGRAGFQVVTISAGGCGQVTGAGPGRQASSGAFWAGLARAMGDPHPGRSALAGTS
ncbi:MAG TPA: hypothetical protein VMH35_23525 [Streptosporangiaceae bacterium]|nr:hypothetical protein [Streptosporangiaceae bacterium]